MIKTNQVKKYSLKEWIILKENILSKLKETANKDHNGVTQQLPGLLLFINYIIDHKEIFETTEDTAINSWLNLRYRKILFKTSTNHLPLLINCTNNLLRVIVMWRLKINK